MIRWHTRLPRSYRLPAVGVGVALTLALSGCGGATKDPAVATAASPGASPGAATSAPSGAVAQFVAQRREWVACIRKQGFDLPDPDARGQVDLRPHVGLKKTEPKWMKAQQECVKLLTPIPEELREKPVWTAAEIQHRRDYARCIRENGEPSFPDPGPDGNWPDTGQQNTEPTEQEVAANLRAQQICGPLQDGRPKGTPNPNATFAG